MIEAESNISKYSNSACKPNDKVLSPAKRRARKAFFNKAFRISIQLVFFILAPGLFASAFSGVKYLFTQIGTLQPFEPTAFLIVLIALLAFTVVFGRFFCGYGCAFGAIGDWVYLLRKAILSKTPLHDLEIPERAMKVLSVFKYVILALICGACLFGVWADISEMSPWTAFAALTTGTLNGAPFAAFILFGICILLMATSERFFCRVLCPMGAIFALMPTLNATSFTRKKEHCAKKCGKCREACPVGIWPDADTVIHGECISCGKCADACPMCNVNLLALPKAGYRSAGASNPVRKTRDEWHLIRGNEFVSVMVKALVLLLISVSIGATRYIELFV